jgi:chromosome segregation ATPase
LKEVITQKLDVED